MNYSETLEYMISQLPMYQRIGAAAYKKDLTNTLAICDRLGNPHLAFPSIHIAGTNGKGSTAHALAAVLQAQGYRVGLYVSPHYKDFRERIKINGEYISKKHIVRFIQENKAFFEELQPSFFEMTVGLAFDYFRTEKVDIAVIETGLGGRLDSTNVINPLLSIITNISYDHVQMLGNTLSAIAEEKAGIIKPNTPVVIGEYLSETQPVFEKKATEMNAPIYYAQDRLEVQKIANDFDFMAFGCNGKHYKVNLSGDYQLQNFRTIMQAIAVLNEKTDFKIEEKNLVEGLLSIKKRVNFIGRWQRIGEKPTILCDSAHNEDGLRYAIGQLTTLPYGRLHIVLGTVNDKDVAKMLSLLPSNAQYYFAKANIPRGLEATLLQSAAHKQGLKGKAYRSVRHALAAARKSAKEDDLIYVGGSIFVVAEVI